MKKILSVIIALIMVFSLISCRKVENRKNETNETEEDNSISEEEKMDTDIAGLNMEPIEVESYLEEIGEVQVKIPVNEAKEVLSEKDVVNLAKDRGFEGYPISAEYTMDGDYIGEEISDVNSDKHPFYEFYYMSKDKELWTINIINGRLTAFPVLYNQESDRETTVIFSETDTLYSYDSVTNTFFEFVPDETTMTVIVIDKIDADKLDSLTKDEIDRY